MRNALIKTVCCKQAMDDPSAKNLLSLRFVLKRRRRERIFGTLLFFFVITIATYLVVYAMRNTASFFRIPSEITQEDIVTGRPLRLGGFIEKGTIEYIGETGVTFFVTDNLKHEKVIFNGILPDLFHEGQGVIVEGSFDKQGLFVGLRVLAKHDENYLPKADNDRLKERQNTKRQNDRVR